MARGRRARERGARRVRARHGALSPLRRRHVAAHCRMLAPPPPEGTRELDDDDADGPTGAATKVDEVESDVERMRSRLRAQTRTDQSQDEALLTLRREVTELKVVVAELTRLLVAGGAVPAEAVERMVRVLETRQKI